MGRSADYSRQTCAVAATLDIVGEPWTLLIIRDAFRGLSRFEQWQDSLGLARNVLAARLKSLVARGVFEQHLYCERPKRYEYRLTAKGLELSPLIVHLMDWGARHIYGEDHQGVALVHSCGKPLAPQLICEHCEAPFELGSVTYRPHNLPSIRELYSRRFAAETQALKAD